MNPWRVSISYKVGDEVLFNGRKVTIQSNGVQTREKLEEIINEDNRRSEMSKTKTFENAKVGDKVWSLLEGWGEILKNDGDNELYVSGRKTSLFYSKTGKLIGHENGNQILFWEEVKIEAPEKPKEKKTLEFSNVVWVEGHGGYIVAPSAFNLHWNDLVNKPPMKMTLEWEE